MNTTTQLQGAIAKASLAGIVFVLAVVDGGLAATHYVGLNSVNRSPPHPKWGTAS